MEKSVHAEVGRHLASEGGLDARKLVELRYGIDDRLPFPQLMLYGLQHVLIMFSNVMVTPLVLGQALDLPADSRYALFSGVMLGCGIGTMVSSLGVFWVGARLPLLLGTYTIYLGPAIAIGKAQGLGAVTVAMLMGGLMLLAVSPIIGKIRSLFPPVVIGIILVVTGIALMKIATNVALGANTPYYGKPITLAFLLGSVVLVGIVANLANRQIRSLSVLFSVVVVYLVGVATGLGNLAAINDAPWVRLPTFLPYGLTWPNAAGLTTILVDHLVAAIYTM